jgi:2-dehydro-3-deoxygluconokinase
MIDVVTAGEAMALFLADSGDPLPVATRFTRSVAGSESNVAIGLARLGHRVKFIGAVGRDAPGRWVRDTLRAEGVDTSALVEDRTRATGILVRDRPFGRALSVVYQRSNSAASARTASPSDLNDVADARAVFVSGISAMLSEGSAEMLDALLDAATNSGVHVFFDPNVRLRIADVAAWRERMSRYLDRVDTLLVGDEELRLLDWPASGADLLTTRTRTVVVKRGAAGASAFVAERRVDQPARSVPTVDPIGAGDAFCTGWISAWLNDLPAESCLENAVTVASLVVATATDITGLPTAAELDAVLTQNGSDVER